MRLLLALVLAVCLLQAAAAQTYRIQPGDTLSVSVVQDPKLDRNVVVAPDGTIAFPLAGHVKVSGLTVAGVEAALKSRLQSNYRDELNVSVSLVGLAPESALAIYVTGEVNKPGAYPLNELGTNAVQAIALSGGLGPFAAKRRILIYRRINGQEIQLTFNYQDYESGRDLSGNIALRSGDVVLVPEKRLFEH